MPFKPGKSPKDVTKRINKVLTTALAKDIQRGLLAMYSVLGGRADFYVPVDTGNTRNSRRFSIDQNVTGWRLTYGYYNDYVKYLYFSRDWKPKPPGTPGKRTGGYNPEAQPDWMGIAWREAGDIAVKAFAKEINK